MNGYTKAYGFNVCAYIYIIFKVIDFDFLEIDAMLYYVLFMH